MLLHFFAIGVAFGAGILAGQSALMVAVARFQAWITVRAEKKRAAARPHTTHLPNFGAIKVSGSPSIEPIIETAIAELKRQLAELERGLNN